METMNDNMCARCQKICAFVNLYPTDIGILTTNYRRLCGKCALEENKITHSKLQSVALFLLGVGALVSSYQLGKRLKK